MKLAGEIQTGFFFLAAAVATAAAVREVLCLSYCTVAKAKADAELSNNIGLLGCVELLSCNSSLSLCKFFLLFVYALH